MINKLIYGLIISLSHSFAQTPQITATSAAPSTLKEAVATAVKLNPITVATDELLESLKLSTLAAKASLYPTGMISCGKTWAQGHTNGTTGHFDSNTGSSSCSLSVSATIYDGGAKYYSYKSIEASTAATEAAYNTTDSLIPNTRGGLASKTMTTYIELSLLRSLLDLSDGTLSFLQKLRAIEDSDNLRAQIAITLQNRHRYRDAVDLLEESFKHLVTRPPSTELESLDETMASLRIPQTSDEAIRLALTNGPEVLRRDLNVKMAEYNLKSIKAGLGPQVSINGSIQKGRGYDYENSIYNNQSTSRYVGIQISVPIGLSGIYQAEAAAKNLQSKKSERTAAMEEARFSISATYKSLSSNKELYVLVSENYRSQLELIQRVSKRIDQGDTAGLRVSDLLVTIANFQSQALQLFTLQQEIVTSLFTVQQVTGLLFSDFAVVVR